MILKRKVFGITILKQLKIHGSVHWHCKEILFVPGMDFIPLEAFRRKEDVVVCLVQRLNIMGIFEGYFRRIFNHYIL